MKMTTTILAAAALVMTAGTSFAAPGKPYGNQSGAGKYGYSKQVHNRGNHVNHRGVSPRERAMIARSASSLAALKQRAWRDGRLSFLERAQIRNAERRHAALVTRVRRS